MKISYNNLLAKFYRHYYYKRDMPNNLCNFFWSTITALLLYPFLFPGVLLRRVTNEKELPAILGILIQLLVFGIGMVVFIVAGVPDQPLSLYNILAVLVIGYGFLISLSLIIVAIVFLFKGIHKATYNEEKKNIREQKRHDKWVASFDKEPGFFKILFKYFKSVKEKNCPLITWKDED